MEEERSKREMEIDKEGEERKRSLERPRVSIPLTDCRLLSESESHWQARKSILAPDSWCEYKHLPLYRHLAGTPRDRFLTMQLSSGVYLLLIKPSVPKVKSTVCGT